MVESGENLAPIDFEAQVEEFSRKLGKSQELTRIFILLHELSSAHAVSIKQYFATWSKGTLEANRSAVNTYLGPEEAIVKGNILRDFQGVLEIDKPEEVEDIYTNLLTLRNILNDEANVGN